MENLFFNIVNAESGVKATIEEDGIWTNAGKWKKHFFQTKLDKSWFQNPKAYISMSGCFLYMIVEGTLVLITLTSNKDNDELYADTLDEATKFNDANFSYEETFLYGLTDSNRIILFSLLPPKKIQEYIFKWDFQATSFRIMLLQHSAELKSNNAFLVESRKKKRINVDEDEDEEPKYETKIETQFFYAPTDYSNTDPTRKLILIPIEKELSLFKNINIQNTPKIHAEFTGTVLEPKTPEDAINYISELRNQLQQYKDSLDQRTRKISDRIRKIDEQKQFMIKKCQFLKERYDKLFPRIQKLIEIADVAGKLSTLSDTQKQAQKALEDFDHDIPDNIELQDDIIFEYRMLQKMLYTLQYNIDRSNQS